MARAQTLGNSTAQKLRTLQEDVEALPDPSTVWEWSEGLDLIGPSPLEQLKALDAIEQVSPDERGGWWRVSPRVAEWMSRVHGVSPRGEWGQDTLPTGRIVPGFDARDADIVESRTRGRQVTLNGDPVTLSNGSVDIRVHDDEDDSPAEPGYEIQEDVFSALERLAAGLAPHEAE